MKHLKTLIIAPPGHHGLTFEPGSSNTTMSLQYPFVAFPSLDAKLHIDVSYPAIQNTVIA